VSEKKTSRPSEFDLIAGLFAPLAKAPGAYGLRDDAAAISPRKGHELIVTTDALVEGVHFLPGDPPETVARKALRVNLSDLAAKGAAPVGYFLALSLPARLPYAWLKAFASGLGRDQKTFCVSLMGGDTTSTPGPLTLAITAVGSAPRGRMIRRAGAKPGHDVFVTGTIGDAGAGLEILSTRAGREARTAASVQKLINRYRLPTPRLKFGQALRNVASAALDVSDGLIADLGHIAEVSGVRIAIEAEKIPRSSALRAMWGDGIEAIVRAATSGDDYEITFTAAPGRAVAAAAKKAGVRVTRIGRVEKGAGVQLLGGTGEIAVSRAGYIHF
jgi:thiamine-monophosphate kinase